MIQLLVFSSLFFHAFNWIIISMYTIILWPALFIYAYNRHSTKFKSVYFGFKWAQKNLKKGLELFNFVDNVHYSLRLSGPNLDENYLPRLNEVNWPSSLVILPHPTNFRITIKDVVNYKFD